MLVSLPDFCALFVAFILLLYLARLAGSELASVAAANLCFIDNIVRNRAAITSPWRQYERHQGNRFGFFS